MPRTPLPSISRTDNLPSQITPFIGREQEAVAVLELLLGHDTRLLTLTGPPGIGKTRLSLDVAAKLAPHYPDGVWFVPLAPVTDPSLAASSIAQVLDLKQSGNRPIAESLGDY